MLPMPLIGHIRELVRYPIKSMAGRATDAAVLGWHGLDGDRRFALRRLGADNGFPWVSASALPDLIRYQPLGLDESTGEPLPTHARTPDGAELALQDGALAAEVAARLGSPVELMRLKHGVFDEAPISLIHPATMARIGSEAGLALDPRRFRANVVIESEGGQAFLEDTWVGRSLVFGDDERGPAVAVTLRDLRCMMINLDPDTAVQDARVMKAAVRLNQNYAGVYATVLRTGTLRVGDRVTLV